MMKSLTLLALLVSDVGPETFNCPKPEGNLIVDSGKVRLAHSGVYGFLPDVLDVDFRCAVDGEGNFVDCTFAARQSLSTAQTGFLEKMMSRLMRAYSTDVPDQRCVASKISFRIGDAARPSITSPDKAARQGEVPN